MPGEHDASLDHGAAFQEFFGSTHYTFDHKGVHFIVLDNVSDPAGKIGDAQLAWLAADLGKTDPARPIVVFTHRPLFDLYPQWDWATRDGAAAVDLLMPHPHVTVFYGHIHQENHHMTGHIAHHAARSLIFPLPAPGSQPKRTPVPWDDAHPYRGLGYREVEAQHRGLDYALQELPVTRGAS
jgi:3',5'-cyclic AMP phosphodiesterase CpdA